MATKFYIIVDPATLEGTYIGGFDGALPPAGSIEVPEPPPHALKYKYINDAWVDQSGAQAKREEAYLQAGITDQAVISAVWEFFSESKSDALDELKAKKEAIDVLIPNP